MIQIETPVPTIARILTGHYKERTPFKTWRPRGTDDWLLMLTLSGLGRVGFHGGEIEARPGDAILLRPGVMHDYGIGRYSKDWELVWTHFHPHQEWFGLLEWPEVATGLMHIEIGDGEPAARIVEALFEMHNRNTGPQLRRELFAVNALEKALLVLDTINPRSAEARLDPRVQTAMEVLLRDLRNHVSLPAAAQACGLSMSRLAHLFAGQTGITPQRFVERERVNRACQALTHTDRPVNAIAADLGFDSPFYFSRRFKLLTGFSPRDYRAGRSNSHP